LTSKIKTILALSLLADLERGPGVPMYSPPKKELTPEQIKLRLADAERKRLCKRIRRLGWGRAGLGEFTLEQLQALLAEVQENT